MMYLTEIASKEHTFKRSFSQSPRKPFSKERKIYSCVSLCQPKNFQMWRRKKLFCTMAKNTKIHEKIDLQMDAKVTLFKKVVLISTDYLFPSLPFMAEFIIEKSHDSYMGAAEQTTLSRQVETGHLEKELF